ncbi:MAG: ribokinase [Candidatus Poribacteria bacterium]
MRRPKITVIGSSNTDLIATVPRLPSPGETVMGIDFIVAPGGKGANQAVAIARIGGDVTFIAKIGIDDNGKRSLENFKKDGINTDFVFQTDEAPSGVALIFVDKNGENMLVPVPGANGKLTLDDIEKARTAIENTDIIVLQLEVPLETVEYAIKIAYKVNVPIVLNPAPGRKLDSDLIKMVTYITPNETEAEILTDIKVTDDNTAKETGERLLQLGAKTAIITLGKRGAMVVNKDGNQLVPAFQVDAIDATAAGDAFTGGFAFAIATGKDIISSVKFGNAVAGLTVTKMGAQPSMPKKDELEEFLKRAEVNI